MMVLSFCVFVVGWYTHCSFFFFVWWRLKSLLYELNWWYFKGIMDLMVSALHLTLICRIYLLFWTMHRSRRRLLVLLAPNGYLYFDWICIMAIWCINWPGLVNIMYGWIWMEELVFHWFIFGLTDVINSTISDVLLWRINYLPVLRPVCQDS